MAKITVRTVTRRKANGNAKRVRQKRAKKIRKRK